MKRVIYALIVPLLVVSGLVFASRESKDEKTEQPAPKPLSDAEKKAEAVKQWEATPGGVAYTKWTASPQGKKVLASAAAISKHIIDSTSMDAVVTDLSLPPGSRLGFGVMVKIEGEDYILNFSPEKSQLEQLRSLKVNDKIIIRGHAVSHAPKYSYAIVTGAYVEREGKMIYKRIYPKGGC